MISEYLVTYTVVPVVKSIGHRDGPAWESPSLPPLPLPTASTPVSLTRPDQTRDPSGGRDGLGPLQPAPLSPGLSGAKRKLLTLTRWMLGGPIAASVLLTDTKLLVEELWVFIVCYM